MEEVIAKSVKTLYIVTYAVLIVVSFLLILLGAILILLIDEYEATVLGWIIIACGIACVIGSIAWLIYFIKMPYYAIKLKDDKLYFRNGMVCSPTELNSFKTKNMGLDGALFGFGKLIISVNGKEFKLKYVDQAENVVTRLGVLKAQYLIKENIANQKNAAEQTNPAEENIQE